MSEGVLRRVTGRAIAALMLAAVVFFALCLSGEAAEFARAGLEIAVMRVLPTAIPSMLICDFYRAYGSPGSLRFLSRAFAFVFGISPSGLRPFILGNLCGFPMGAREIAAAYREGRLTKKEAERLLPLSSNPSPTFVMGAVGIAMLGSAREGLLLLAALMLATLIAGVLFRKNGYNREFIAYTSRQSYSFVDSVSDAAVASVTLIGFISAFSVLTGFIKKHLTFVGASSLLISIIEVTGGVVYFATESELVPYLRSAAIAFTLGFGGLSVAAQSAAFVKGAGLSMKRYFTVKIVEAILCSAIYLMLNRIW